MKRIKTYLLTICVLSFAFFVCFSCNSGQNPPVKVHFQRFDEAVFSQNPKELLQNYPEFAPFYFQKIIKTGIPQDSISQTYLEEFKNTYKSKVYDSVQFVFKDLNKVEKQLGQALGNYKAIFPNDSLPDFYTHFSGFNESVVTTGKIVSVSLESYLGESACYYELGVYKYLRIGMYPDKIAPDILKLLLLQKVPTKNATNNLLSAMLYQGKLMYLLQEIFPKRSLASLMNYTDLQEEWCEKNENVMWEFLIEHKHLFTSEYRTIRAYIDPTPYTKFFPVESPGQTGIWLGYQIIKNYMNNTQSSINDLLQNTNYQEILQKSTYNPIV